MADIDRFVQFRFVPTMRCNLKCSYCFLAHSRGSEPTMFDRIRPSEWVAAMGNFSHHQAEFYLWGGEPLCLEGTFELVKGFAEYDFVTWARIDHNLTCAKKIVERCPSEKLKLNCSWHTETFAYDQMRKRVALLHRRRMVGMVNFVASDANLAYLKSHRLNLDDIVRQFDDEGIFFNVAADFGKGNDPHYREFILRYTNPDDWKYIHGLRPSRGVACDAGATMFTVEHDGTLTSCGRRRRRVGNFFRGKLKRKQGKCPRAGCVSLVSYCHQANNDFSAHRHLEDYARRCRAHRKGVTPSSLEIAADSLAGV